MHNLILVDYISYNAPAATFPFSFASNGKPDLK